MSFEMLIAEDNFNQFFVDIVNSLKNKNIICDIASNKSTIAYRLKKKSYDIVSFDLSIKGYSGINFAQKIRDGIYNNKIGTKYNIPIIIFTGSNKESISSLCQQFKCTYMNKLNTSVEDYVNSVIKLLNTSTWK